MTEQISHKKSLRVSRLDKDRALLLSQYQDQDQDQNEERNTNSQNTITPEEDSPVPSFKELIHTHNELLGKEQDTNNLIKSTIYDNYYDLIRCNELLQDFINPQGDINTLFDKLQENIQR